VRAGEYGAVYGNMPVFGLAAAARQVPARQKANSAAARIGAAAVDQQAAAPTEAARHLTVTEPPDIDLLDGAFYADDPHPKYAWLRAQAPVWFDAGNGVWGAASYDAVMAASKDTTTFSSTGGIRPDSGPLPMMIDMDDPAHWKRRKLVNRGFTPRRVRDSEGEIRGVCDAIIDRVCERGECDFVRDIAAPLPMILIGDMLGVAPTDRDDLLRWSDDMVSAQGGEVTETQMAAAATAFSEYSAYARRVIEARRSRPADDLMSVLVHAEVDGDRLDDDEVVYESLLILVGGDETTRHVISGGMEQLLLRPDQWERLRARAQDIPLAVEEMLRWVSPIKNMCRTVAAETSFFGQQLSAGQKVMLLYESANFDEGHFADPERFDSLREPNEHMAFGFGSHFCLGNSLARLELQVMFGQLVSRMPDLELATSGPLRRRRANFISGIESMPVRFTPSSRWG
jgi:cytochrome P450 family 142 subfamily A polypeptide 1